MPDFITEEERKLIDEAIASGLVKKIPVNVHSFAGYRWDDKTNSVVMVEHKPINTNFTNGKNTGRDTLNKNRAIAAEKRKVTIKELLKSGKTKHEIANLMSLNYRTINKLVGEIEK